MEIDLNNLPNEYIFCLAFVPAILNIIITLSYFKCDIRFNLPTSTYISTYLLFCLNAYIVLLKSDLAIKPEDLIKFPEER